MFLDCVIHERGREYLEGIEGEGGREGEREREREREREKERERQWGRGRERVCEGKREKRLKKVF